MLQVMDTIADLRTPEVEWSPVAETMLEQFSEGERAEIRAAVTQASRTLDSSELALIRPVRPDERPFYVLPVSERLMVFVARDDPDRLRVLDVMRPEQLDVFRDGPDIVAGGAAHFTRS
jgi:hypothetical protein